MILVSFYYFHYYHYYRRETSQLLRTIWSTLLFYHPSFPLNIISLLQDDFGLIKFEQESLNTNLQSLCIYETILWASYVLLEVTSDYLSLDEDNDNGNGNGNDEDNNEGDDEEENYQPQLRTEDIELLQIWWNISINITKSVKNLLIFHENFTSDNSILNNIFIQFLNLWQLFPLILNSIEKCNLLFYFFIFNVNFVLM